VRLRRAARGVAGLSVETLRLTGDSRIADALEHATWNAVLGYQHPSGRWCTYDTPMNGKRLASAHSIVFQSRPGTPELNCCSVNGPNGLGLLGQWAILGGKNGLYLNYYGPGTTEVKLEDGSAWSLTQKTGYPRWGPWCWRFVLRKRRRCPCSCASRNGLGRPQSPVNGAPVEKVTPGAYLKLDRTWNPGDKVALDLDCGCGRWRGTITCSSTRRCSAGPFC